MEKSKQEKLKYLVIQISAIVLLVFAFAFWLQPFISTQSLLGTEQYSITGMEVAFGFSKEISIPSPTFETLLIEYKQTIFVLIGFISFLFVLLTQIILFILRLTKKISIKIYQIINFVCAILIIIPTIACFFSSNFFIIANHLSEKVFISSGSITTGILYIAIFFAIILNSIDLFIKKKEK